jgi:DNA-binding XRE family transcriptional regulator
MNLGLSPESFGYEVGVSGFTVRRIEDGKNLRVRTAFLIAQHMGVPVTDLWPAPSMRRSAKAVTA